MSKVKPLDLNMKSEVKRISNYIVEIVSEAYPMMEEDKQELKGTIEMELDDLLVKVKQRINSACEFYLKYKDNPELFSKEQYKIKWERYRDIGCLVWVKKMWINYNEWLFKLAFKEVLKNEKD